MLFTGCSGTAADENERRAVQVDFFSNNIKALELSQQLSAMKILTKEVSSLSDPYKMFHLDEEAILQPPKWAPANEWTVNDDSMLLLSAALYGIGHWDNIAADDRLGLKAKLQGAIKDGTKVGDKAFPQGAHARPSAALRSDHRHICRSTVPFFEGILYT